MKNLCYVFAVIVFPIFCSAEDAKDAYEARSVIYTGGEYKEEVFHYRLLKPAKIEEGKKYPVIFFLHGAGERGDDNAKQLVHFAGQMAEQEWRTKYPCFIVVPQCRKDRKWANKGEDGLPAKEMSHQMGAALLALKDVLDAFPVDKKRVYLTGLSMGGYGSWDLSCRHPSWFAAVVPICGGGNPELASALKDVPVWAFHGDKDKAVPVEKSRKMIDAIKKADGKPKYTEYPGVGHNSWTQAYADQNGVIPWLFKQKNDRGEPFLEK